MQPAVSRCQRVLPMQARVSSLLAKMVPEIFPDSRRPHTDLVLQHSASWTRAHSSVISCSPVHILLANLTQLSSKITHHHVFFHWVTSIHSVISPAASRP